MPDAFENTLESAALTRGLKDNIQNLVRIHPQNETTSQATFITRTPTHYPRKS